MSYYTKKCNFHFRHYNFSIFFTLIFSLTPFISMELMASDTQAPTSEATSKSKPTSTSTSTSEQFLRVKKAIFSDVYELRPNYVVNRKLFGKANNSKNNKLLNAAKRTLTDSRDLIELPNKQKLLQANGICFAGTWSIDKNSHDINNDTNEKTKTKNMVNNFTGLFSTGTLQSVIVRASVALSGTTQKDKRAFGMAIKFFPDDLKATTSLNAFVLNSFGGVVSKHILDLPMDNQPTLGSLPKLRDIGTALRLKKDLEKADRAHGAKKPHFSFRPITQLANYQDIDDKLLNTSHMSPKWLRLTAKTSQRIDADDFRDELDVSAYPNKQIVYSISVAKDSSKKSQAQWQTIGQLTLKESITSASCDQRLHFQHPRLN